MPLAILLYFIGLIISGIAVGHVIEAVYGWLLIGVGLMTLGTMAMILNHLNHPPKEKEHED